MPLRIFVSSGAVHCFVAAAEVKFQTGQNLSVNLSVLTNRQNLSVVGSCQLNPCLIKSKFVSEFVGTDKPTEILHSFAEMRICEG